MIKKPYSTRVHLPWLTFKFMVINSIMLLVYHLLSFNLRIFERWSEPRSLLVFGIIGLLMVAGFFLMRSAVKNTFGIFIHPDSINFEFPLYFHKKIYPWEAFKGFSTSHSLNFNVIIFYLKNGEHIVVSQRSVWNFADFRYFLGKCPITYLGREPFRLSLAFPNPLKRRFLFDSEQPGKGEGR